MSAIEDAMKKMHKHRAIHKTKGDFGELAVIEVVKAYSKIRGGRVYHSYKYRYASNRHGINYPGNIHRDANGKYTSVNGNSGTEDEIDVLYITPYRIFVIEAKARGGVWKIDEEWCTQNSRPVDKSPIAQGEKHARHLYHSLYEYLPDGNENYIVPIVVYVDRVRVMDSRSAKSKFYIPATIVNQLKKKLASHDTPLQYELDIDSIMEKLKQLGKGQLLL